MIGGRSHVLVLAFLAFFLAASSSSAQMFLDNFEGYNLGSLEERSRRTQSSPERFRQSLVWIREA
jgi:hypothetical protein